MDELTRIECTDSLCPLCSVDVTDRLLTLGMGTERLIYDIKDGMYHFTLSDAMVFLKEEFDYDIDTESVRYDKESESLVMDIHFKSKECDKTIFVMPFPNAINILTDNIIKRVAITLQTEGRRTNSEIKRMNEYEEKPLFKKG